MNEDQRNHVIIALKENIRIDKRRCDEYREISIEYGVSKSAEGSAKVKMGNTEVIAGVKLSVESPFPDTPENGNLMVNAELLPLSSPEFESGPPGIEAIELARVVDRGVRESKAIDTKKLCIKKGEKVWTVSVDICTLNTDGNLLDASALATIAALKDARFPKYDGTSIDYHELTDEPLPMKKLPISVTVYKVGDSLLIDPDGDEEEVVDSRLTVAFTDSGEICAMQKGGEQPLTSDEIKAMVELSLKKSIEIRKHLK